MQVEGTGNGWQWIIWIGSRIFFFGGGNSTGQHHIYMGKLTEMNMISGCDFASDESIDTEI